MCLATGEVQVAVVAEAAASTLEVLLRLLCLHSSPPSAGGGCVSGVHVGVQAQDLADWRDSPEQFHHESDVGSWQDNLRVCSEALLLVLLERSRPAVAPVVLAVAQAACDAAPPGSTAQLAASGAPATGGTTSPKTNGHLCRCFLGDILVPSLCYRRSKNHRGVHNASCACIPISSDSCSSPVLHRETSVDVRCIGKTGGKDHLHRNTCIARCNTANLCKTAEFVCLQFSYWS